jgi:predicted nuclease of restriction endonuclease-like RecB superfamily
MVKSSGRGDGGVVMLTRELAITSFDWQHGVACPDRLTRKRHAHYVPLAERMLAIYAGGEQHTRRELHRAVHQLFADADDCPLRRIDAFCKLLDERATYDNRPARRAPKLRQQVFRLAARHHPLVQSADQLFNSDLVAVRHQIAAELGTRWEEIEQTLFADVIEFHRLKSFDAYASPEAFLARYNVAQCQAALYDATHLTVQTSQDFKVILRAAKLARLMHRIERLPGGQYRISLDGPASVLRDTRRYGVELAKFLPSLLSCSDWRMVADLRIPRHRRRFRFELTSADGYQSEVAAAPAFDSGVEQLLAEKWGIEPRNGWQLKREDTILSDRQTVFIPDFTFVHADGRQVLAEVIGFWTPEYLSHKVAVLRQFARTQFLLIVAHSVADAIPRDCGCAIVTYKSAIKISDVLAALPAGNHFC